MSNIINFLERVGEDANLRYADRMELQTAMRASDIDAVGSAVIFADDSAALDTFVGARKNLCCMVYPVDSAN